MKNAFNHEAIKQAVAKLPVEAERSVWQQFLDLGYNEWQTRKELSYPDMLTWVANTYGEVVKLFILLGKYNQQVCNGGHVQYFDNGYASGPLGFGRRHSDDCELHDELKRLFTKYGFHNLKHGQEIYAILNEFVVERATEDEYSENDCDEGEDVPEGYRRGDLMNGHALDELDTRYYAIYEEFEKVVEANAVAWLKTGVNPITDKTPPLKAKPAKPPVAQIGKPALKLVGRDGNAFAIIGAAVEALRKAGTSPEVIKEYRTKAMSGRYDDVLIATMEYCEVS